MPVPGPGGTSGVTTGQLGNSDLRPERGKELEAGFEANVFERLSLDFTYYNKHTENEIVAQSVAPSSGFTGNQFLNLGRVDNHGIELGATLQAFTRNVFSWDIAGSVATTKNIIKDLGGLPTLVTTAGQFNVVGYPIGGIFSRRVVSADRNPVGTPAGGWATNILCDGGSGKAPVACNTAPFLFLGTPTPKITGSVANEFTFVKRLRIHTLVDFKGGHRVYNANDAIRCTAAVGTPLCRANYYPNEFAPIDLAQMTTAAINLGMSDEWYQPGSFAKLREVSATYTLPDRLLRGFSRASVSLAGRELHTWTKYKSIDPEASDITNAGAGTHDQAVLPPLSRIIATINVTF